MWIVHRLEAFQKEDLAMDSMRNQSMRPMNLNEHCHVALKNHPVWMLFLAVLYSIWWGGLTFYALIVVPIGSDITSTIEQGLVTQRVTNWHNWLTILVTACSWIMAFVRKRLIWWGIATMLLVLTLGLISVHRDLSNLIDPMEHSITDDFYSIHATYLWLTTAEWFVGLLGLVIYVRDLFLVEAKN